MQTQSAQGEVAAGAKRRPIGFYPDPQDETRARQYMGLGMWAPGKNDPLADRVEAQKNLDKEYKAFPYLIVLPFVPFAVSYVSVLISVWGNGTDIFALTLIAAGVALTYLLLVVLPWKATLANYEKLVTDYHTNPQACVARSRQMTHYAHKRSNGTGGGTH
jgi:hypothetical protein